MTYKEHNGILYRELLRTAEGVWLIRSDGCTSPQYVCQNAYSQWPTTILDDQNEPLSKERKQTQKKRQEMLAPLIEKESSIFDAQKRKSCAAEIAVLHGLSVRCVLKLYYTYLAKGEYGLAPAKRKRKEKELSDDQKKMLKGLNKYYYSSNRMSLSMAYELMLMDSYKGENDKILESHPTLNQFRYLYQKTKNEKKKLIAREGIGCFRKDHRPLSGMGNAGVNKVGVYELDATVADVYIVSKYDRQPIGRPYIYLAVDISSRLITGIHICMENNASAVLSCLVNAASNKVEFCREFGIQIKQDAWPSQGLPRCICTDRGLDFMSERVIEMCELLHIEMVNLPAYRPDLKGYVEKAIDCLQNRYKPLLHGKGVIEKNAMGINDSEYCNMACLDIDDFTRILIQCVLYYNSHHVIQNYARSQDMICDGVEPVAAKLWAWHIKTGHTAISPVREIELRMMLMSRGKATITRRGLKFHRLYYVNQEYMDEFSAAASAHKKVTVAYMPDKNDTVFLIRDGSYIAFTLAPAYQRYEKLTFHEVELLLSAERKVKKELEAQQLEGSISCNQEIAKIIESAQRETSAKRR